MATIKDYEQIIFLPELEEMAAAGLSLAEAIERVRQNHGIARIFDRPTALGPFRYATIPLVEGVGDKAGQFVPMPPEEARKRFVKG